MVDTRVSIALEVKLFKMKKVFYKKNVGPVEQKKNSEFNRFDGYCHIPFTFVYISISVFSIYLNIIMEY